MNPEAANHRRENKDPETRRVLMDTLKKDIGYVKDQDLAKKRRERWKSIYETATYDGTTDPDTIAKRIHLAKQYMYTEEELAEENKSTTKEGGYDVLYKQYGNDEKYKSFFSKVSKEGNDHIFDGKKLSMLSAKPNGSTIVDGGNVVNGKAGGMVGVTYMTGEAAKDEADKQGKTLFASKEEMIAFVEQFPGETLSAKINSFVTFYNLKMAGSINMDTQSWNGVNESGFIGLSYNKDKKTSGAFRWSDGASGYTPMAASWPIPYLAFEEVK